MFPHGNDIGKDRTPSHRYPSDHFSLLCDFELVDEEKMTNGDGDDDANSDNETNQGQ